MVTPAALAPPPSDPARHAGASPMSDSRMLAAAAGGSRPPPPNDDGQGEPDDGAPGDPELHHSTQNPDDDVDFVLLNDDVLTSVSNATLVLLDGSDLERMAVLYQFPQFLEHCPDETLTIMVPEIGSFAVGWKENVQMAAAEALYFVVNMAVPEDVAKRIVVAALRIIQESESGEVFDAWGEILSMMLPQVKRADVQALVVPATVDRAASHTVESRRLAARIIGSLNDTLTAEELEAKFLSHALVLCDDHDPSVRAMIAQSLASLGTKLPLHVSEQYLWPKLDRLMHDDNPRVRAAAMRAVARTAEAHAAHCKTSASFSTLLLPVFLHECATAYEVAGTDLRTVDDDTYLMLEIFSEVYGYFLCAVSPLFASTEVWTDALNSLRRMVTCNGPTVRHWCAFNVPAVAQVCASSRPEKIHGVIQALSSDTDVETRATLAAGIHETTALLADSPLRDEMLAAIAMLMTDQNPQVRMNSLRHFADILTLLSETGPMATQNAPLKPPSAGGATVSGPVTNGKLKKSGAAAATSAVSATAASYNNPNTTNSAAARQLDPIVSSLETMSHDSWRTQKLLAEQLEASARLIPQEMLCEHVAPLLFSMARESTYLVRKASMSALVSVIRYIPDVRRRDHILKHFRSEWARGKVYWTRLAYIDASQVALGMLSNKLFTQLFAAELFSLARDPVANVRLRLARLLPQLATACGSKTAFVAALDTLLDDVEDADVVHEARLAKKAISVKPPRTFAEADEDAKKEAAEKHFFVQRQKRRGATGPGAGTGTRTATATGAGAGAGAKDGAETGADRAGRAEPAAAGAETVTWVEPLAVAGPGPGTVTGHGTGHGAGHETTTETATATTFAGGTGGGTGPGAGSGPGPGAGSRTAARAVVGTGAAAVAAAAAAAATSAEATAGSVATKPSFAATTAAVGAAGSAGAAVAAPAVSATPGSPGSTTTPVGGAGSIPVVRESAPVSLLPNMTTAGSDGGDSAAGKDGPRFFAQSRRNATAGNSGQLGKDGSAGAASRRGGGGAAAISRKTSGGTADISRKSSGGAPTVSRKTSGGVSALSHKGGGPPAAGAPGAGKQTAASAAPSTPAAMPAVMDGPHVEVGASPRRAAASTPANASSPAPPTAARAGEEKDADARQRKSKGGGLCGCFG